MRLVLSVREFSLVNVHKCVYIYIYIGVCVSVCVNASEIPKVARPAPQCY